MKVELKKFGEILNSRDDGREALLAISPELDQVSSNETIEVDSIGVFSMSLSWADEFLSPLRERFGDRLVILPTDNPSINEAMEFLGIKR